ncbi:30S ribosomal protein S2 [Candidatus Parcubacteria bacterium]|nr:MAG: 30S ribosomal protein S2 [Candidatus Parcubacteria bacterium]
MIGEIVKDQAIFESLSSQDQAVVSEMYKAGVHIGHSKSKRHPKMDSFIFATRHNISLIDLSKTLSALRSAAVYVKDVVDRGGIVLCVGTNPAIKDLVFNFAKDLKQPYVVERWLGGTLTNYKTISKRLDYHEDLSKKHQGGQLEKYTKKEQLIFSRKLDELNEKFEGLKLLKRIPDTIFVVDLNRHKAVIDEARKTGVKVVGVSNTDADPGYVDYPIPANDNSRSSVGLILSTLLKMIKDPNFKKEAEK